jgi:hypothetical protein
MFKFNFNIEENNSNENFDNKEEENCLTNQEFGCLNIEDLDEEINRTRLEFNGTDLVPNVYEGKIIELYVRIKRLISGGFKTWECSYDLVDYLKTILENFQNITTVLEVSQ